MCRVAYSYVPRRIHVSSMYLLALSLCQVVAAIMTSTSLQFFADMGWLRLVGSLKLYVSFVRVPYKRDDILQKRPVIFRSPLTVATP